MHLSPDVLALLAVGEPADAVTLEHLRDCAQCRLELEDLRRVVDLGRATSPADTLFVPPASVWLRVQDALAASAASRVVPLHASAGATTVLVRQEDPEPERAPAHDRAASPARPRRRWATVVLAAALALVVGVGLGFGITRALTPTSDVVGITTLNALPRWHGANGTATVEKDAQGNRTLVITVELPPSASVDGRMEVWMSDSRANDMVAMGLMPGTSGRFAIPPTMDLMTHPIIDVSLEPTNDTNPAHSGVSVVRGRLAL